MNVFIRPLTRTQSLCGSGSSCSWFLCRPVPCGADPVRPESSAAWGGAAGPAGWREFVWLQISIQRRVKWFWMWGVIGSMWAPAMPFCPRNRKRTSPLDSATGPSTPVSCTTRRPTKIMVRRQNLLRNNLWNSDDVWNCLQSMFSLILRPFYKNFFCFLFSPTSWHVCWPSSSWVTKHTWTPARC